MPLDKDIVNARYANESATSGEYYEKDLRRSKFEINLQKYPSDLGSDDLLHYIEFGINVRGRSEVDKSKRLFQVNRDPSSANLSEEELSTVATLGAVAVGGVAGYAVAQGVLKIIERSGSRGAQAIAANATRAIGRTGAGTVGAIGGAVLTAEAISANQILKPDTTYRISDVIALHIDGPPTVKYGMNYANKDLGTLAGIIKGGAADALKTFNPTSEQFAAAATAFAKLPGAFGTVDLQSALSASTKTSLNPFREVIFESVDFRSFSFRYKFLPKNKAESEAVRNIIKLFKYHMHPEMSASKLFFIYPSEFQITYYFQNAVNNYMHKFAPCVLESMEVSYGGEQFSSFSDGNPTEVNMTLIFRETEILTKKMIDKGY